MYKDDGLVRLELISLMPFLTQTYIQKVTLQTFIGIIIKHIFESAYHWFAFNVLFLKCEQAIIEWVSCYPAIKPEPIIKFRCFCVCDLISVPTLFLYHSRFSRETEPTLLAEREKEKAICYKRFYNIIYSYNTEAEKSHRVQTASWRPRKVGGGVLVQAQRPETKGAKV